MPSLFVYVIDRDFGFAPNPFHGFCTLATCKPRIRKTAEIRDWIIGMGGSRLNAIGRCIFAMQVTATISFDEYWANPIYTEKKPVRNGSRKMMVGDNIYHRDVKTNKWGQADSHHSNLDGTVNPYNLKRDTRINRVLLSTRFFYFGAAARCVPQSILDQMRYKNPRDYRRFDSRTAQPLLDWLQANFRKSMNELLGDPFDFAESGKRYSGKGSKIV
jgi:putative DNA base modification enzyme with NMAD domain